MRIFMDDTDKEEINATINEIKGDLSQLSEEKVGNPPTGAVGQILEIETVNESGKPKTYKAVNKPEYTAAAIGAEPSGTVSAHNTAVDAHNDIRLLIEGLTTRLNALADSDDTTLDQMSEVVAYIKSNKSLIDAITTSKINVSDIIDNLTTNVANKPLSAAQGVALKALIDGILPAVTTADNGKFLRVSDGVWSAVTLTNAEEVAY